MPSMRLHWSQKIKMSDKYTCMKCKASGAKSMIPYKIIEDIDGESVRFKGQLCERCFNELMTPAQTTSDISEETK